MRVLNEIDRFHIVLKALKELNRNDNNLREKMEKIIDEHKKSIYTTGKDLDIVTNWKWKDAK